jgi:iron complex outermembrane recepter protein
MGPKSRKRVPSLGLATAIGLVLSGGAQAADAGAGQLDEIIVTAQKREQSVKDVPTSISVIGGDDLLAHNITSIEDVTRSVPGISFNSGGSGIGIGVGQTNIAIRGVSSSSGASTVGVYFDDVAVNVDNKNGIGAPVPMLFDLQRLEVLRGPQGTLFGASSEGGTVRYIFNPAKLNDTSGDVGVDIGSTQHGGFNYQATAVANIPLVEDAAALRVDLGYGHQSGWIDNYSLDGALLHRGVNDNSTLFLRLAATIQASSSVKLTPQLLFQEIKSSDSPVFYLQDQAYYEANPYTVPPPLPTDGLYRQHKQVQEPTRDRIVIPSLTATVDLGSVDFTSVSSYYYRPYDRQTDGTTFDSYVLAVAILGRPPTDRVLATLPSPVYQPVTYRTFSQEFRFASHEPGAGELPLRWVAGLYYSDQKADYSNNDYIPGLQSTFLQTYGYDINSAQSPIGVPSIPNLYANDAIYLESGTYDTKQYALFGQIEYQFAPRWHASAGVRSTYAKSSTAVTQGGFFAGGNFFVAQSDHFSSTTPKFSLVYDLTSDVTVYANAGKGFRLGGELYTPLPVTPGNICAGDYQTFGLGSSPSSAYDSDSLWSYEVGSKGRALNNTVAFNVAGYYVKWNNLQQAIYLPTCGYYDTVNIGNAEIYGTELEMHVKPAATPGFTFGLNGGFTHATLLSSTNLLTAQPGQHIPNTPRWTADASVEYSHPLGALGRGFVAWDYDYTGPANGTYQMSSPNYMNPSYGVMNLTLGVEMSAWQVSLYARNLLNNQTVIQSPTINALVTGYAVQPLTVGLHVGKRF